MAKQKIEVWVGEEDLARIDQVRGLAPRSAWARDILHDAVTDGLTHHGVPTVTIDAGSRTIGGKGIRVTKIEGAGPPMDDITITSPREHRHRYVNDPEPTRHVKGQPVYVRRCACGDTKESS